MLNIPHAQVHILSSFPHLIRKSREKKNEQETF